jgi:hypothetical protein
MKPKKENVVKIPDHYTQLGAESFKFVWSVTSII